MFTGPRRVSRVQAGAQSWRGLVGNRFWLIAHFQYLQGLGTSTWQGSYGLCKQSERCSGSIASALFAFHVLK